MKLSAYRTKFSSILVFRIFQRRNPRAVLGNGDVSMQYTWGLGRIAAAIYPYRQPDHYVITNTTQTLTRKNGGNFSKLLYVLPPPDPFARRPN